MEWPLIEQIYHILADTTRSLLLRSPKQAISIDILEKIIILIKPIKPTSPIEQTTFFTLRYCVGLLLLAEKQLDKANEIFQFLLVETPNSPMVLFCQAELAFQAGHHKLAKSYITQALTYEPHNILFRCSQYKIIQTYYLQTPNNNFNKTLVKRQLEAFQIFLPKIANYESETFFFQLVTKEFKTAVLTIDYLLLQLIQQTIIDRLESSLHSQVTINALLGKLTPEAMALRSYTELMLKSHQDFLYIYNLCYKDAIEPYDNTNSDIHFLSMLTSMETRRNAILIFAAQIGNLAAYLENSAAFLLSINTEKPFENSFLTNIHRNSIWNTAIAKIPNLFFKESEEMVYETNSSQTSSIARFKLV